jgi:hypothetical protein
MKSKSWPVLVSLASLSLSGCSSSQAHGQVVAEGTKLGTWTYVLDGAKGGCKGGYVEKFLGADLFLNDVTMRVLRDPRQGPVIQFLRTGSQLRVEVTQEMCSTLDLKVERVCEGESCIQTVGSVAFACNVPTGGRFAGTVSFRCW